MKKNNFYTAPTIEALSIFVEQGFALSSGVAGGDTTESDGSQDASGWD